MWDEGADASDPTSIKCFNEIDVPACSDRGVRLERRTGRFSGPELASLAPAAERQRSA